MRDAVVKALDDQNLVIFGEDETRCEERGDDISFIDADFNTEIIFYSNRKDGECEQSGTLLVPHLSSQLSEIPIEVCQEESISEQRRDATKPAVDGDALRKQKRQRKKRTLLQRMKRKR